MSAAGCRKRPGFRTFSGRRYRWLRAADNFDVPEVAGLVVKQLVGFTDAASDDHPQKLLLIREGGRRHAFSLTTGWWGRAYFGCADWI